MIDDGAACVGGMGGGGGMGKGNDQVRCIRGIRAGIFNDRW